MPWLCHRRPRSQVPPLPPSTLALLVLGDFRPPFRSRTLDFNQGTSPVPPPLYADCFSASAPCAVVPHFVPATLAHSMNRTTSTVMSSWEPEARASAQRLFATSAPSTDRSQAPPLEAAATMSPTRLARTKSQSPSLAMTINAGPLPSSFELFDPARGRDADEKAPNLVDADAAAF